MLKPPEMKAKLLFEEHISVKKLGIFYINRSVYNSDYGKSCNTLYTSDWCLHLVS